MTFSARDFRLQLTEKASGSSDSLLVQRTNGLTTER